MGFFNTAFKSPDHSINVAFKPCYFKATENEGCADICDPPQDFNAKDESTRTTRFHSKTKEFILTRFSTLAILPH